MGPILIATLGVAGAVLARELLGGRDPAPDVPGGGGGVSTFLPQAKRDQVIFDQVAAGDYELPPFTTVQAERDGHLVEVYAACDALRVGPSRGRVMVSHEVAQSLADALGLFLPTSRMSDMAWLSVPAARRLGPVTMPADSHMADEATALAASVKIDTAMAAKGIAPGELVRVVGKEWITSERLLEQDGSIANVRGGNQQRLPGTVAGCNFGWQWSQGQSRTPGGIPCIQSPGLRHDLRHYDYSQLLTLYQPTCAIDGVGMNVADVLLNPSLAYLLSDEVPKGKACRVTRHPAMPLEFASV